MAGLRNIGQVIREYPATCCRSEGICYTARLTHCWLLGWLLTPILRLATGLAARLTLLGQERVLTKPPGYVLRVEPEEVDRAAFERLREEGRPHEALSLWRGPALAELAHRRFAQAEIARLEELRLEWWGSGDDAGGFAGRMRQQGRMWLLWPRGEALPRP